VTPKDLHHEGMNVVGCVADAPPPRLRLHRALLPAPGGQVLARRLRSLLPHAGDRGLLGCGDGVLVDPAHVRTCTLGYWESVHLCENGRCGCCVRGCHLCWFRVGVVTCKPRRLGRSHMFLAFQFCEHVLRTESTPAMITMGESTSSNVTATAQLSSRSPCLTGRGCGVLNTPADATGWRPSMATRPCCFH